MIRRVEGPRPRRRPVSHRLSVPPSPTTESRFEARRAAADRPPRPLEPWTWRTSPMDRLPRTLAACGLGLLAGRRRLPEHPPRSPAGPPVRQRRPAAARRSSSAPRATRSARRPRPTSCPTTLGGSNLAAGHRRGRLAARPGRLRGPAGRLRRRRGPPASASRPAWTRPRPTRPRCPPPPAPAGLPPLAPPAGLAARPRPRRRPRPEASRPTPNQVIQPPMDAPGAMGRPDQMPSPN